METTNKVQIEINGVKMEVDTRYATRIEKLQIGSRVKVLVKEYSNTVKVHPGVIVGFDPFKALPTLTICYLEIDYSGAVLKFVYYNAKTENVEVVASVDNDTFALDQVDILAKMDKQIAIKQNEIRDLQERRVYFLKQFGQYFEGGLEPKLEAELQKPLS